MQIQFKDVIFKYDSESKEVLKKVSFDIKKGSYTSIIGHNGSGKSTIAKLMVGLLEKKSGSIVIDGDELTNDNIHQVRQKVAIVFQNPDNQFIGATVRDDIAFGLENRQVDPRAMDHIIEAYALEVNMAEFLDQEPTKLSGGQKQRVALAGVLAMQPKILILDEATAMLDPKGKKEIYDFVDRLHKQFEMTIISITHDIEAVKKSDQVIVMNEGVKVFDGSPVEILVQQDNLVKVALDAPFSVKLFELLEPELKLKLMNPLDEKELVEALWQLNLNK